MGGEAQRLRSKTRSHDFHNPMRHGLSRDKVCSSSIRPHQSRALIVSRNRFDIWRNDSVPFPVLTAAQVMSGSQDPESVSKRPRNQAPLSTSAAASKKAKKGILDRAKRLLQRKPQPPSDAFRPASDDSASSLHTFIPAPPFTPVGDWHFKVSSLGRFFSSRERLGTALSVPFRKLATSRKSRKH